MNYKLPAALLLPLSFIPLGVNADTTDATDTLPDAKAGECYAKVMIPATYKTITEKILATEASETISTIPAEYSWKEDRVLIKEASKKIIPIAATYKTVSEKILVKAQENTWFTSLKSQVPVSSAILSAAKAGGIDVVSSTPGVCYREYFTPASYETKSEQYIAKEASNTLSITPAAYNTVQEKTLVKEASKKIVAVPATYDYVEEKILVEAEKTIWKKGSGLIEKVDNTTGEIMCLVTVPAVYKTVRKKIVKTPATTKIIEVPAVYKTIEVNKVLTIAAIQKTPVNEVYNTISKTEKVADAKFQWKRVGEKIKGIKYTGHQVCLVSTPDVYKTIHRKVVDTPATTKEIENSAIYKTMKVKTLVTDAQESKAEIPASYKTISKREKTSGERLEWKRVLCKTNMSVATVKQIQKALQKANFYTHGPIDGIIGKATLDAIDGFQKTKSLPRGGLTYKTLDALGVQITG